VPANLTIDLNCDRAKSQQTISDSYRERYY